MSRYHRLGRLLDDVHVAAGEWVRLPGAGGVELYQHNGPPLAVSWFPFGNLPNGVAMCVRTDVHHDDGPVIPGYWDLTLARQRCLIRHATPGSTPLAIPTEEIGEQTLGINGAGAT